MTESPPSTADYVRFHALHSPGSIAMIEDGREIDYATFHRDLRIYTRALRSLGCPRGTVVAVAHEKFYEHWLMLLACENLGWLSATFLPQEADTLAQLFVHSQLVLSIEDFPKAGRLRRQRVTKEWLAEAGAKPDAGDGEYPPMGMEELQRMRRSSGSTGGFKLILCTRRAQERWVHDHLLGDDYTARSRLLVPTHLGVGGTYARAVACLRLGATSIWNTKLSLAKALQTYRPTHTRIFQFQMRALFDALSPGSKPADLTVSLGAAPLSTALQRELLEKVASRIVYAYGSNETAWMGLIGDDGICTLRPGVEAETVDERGALVPAGQRGELRVRSDGLASGYLGNPELTAQKFRDGWFYTGDAATMLAPGRLRLEGRADGVINIGGRKFAPEAIEELIEQKIAVEDVAVTSRLNGDGIEELCIAVVPKDGASPRAIDDIRNYLPPDFGAIHVAVVNRILRTAQNGKIRRDELKKLFAPK